jgi:hypothetical protein
MSVQIAPDVEAKLRDKVETGNYADIKHSWLLEALAEGEKGEAIEFTPERMDLIRQRARENARQGKPISDAVTP